MATLGRRPNRYSQLLKACLALVLLGLVFQMMDKGADEPRNPIIQSVSILATPLMRAGAAAHEAVDQFWTGFFASRRLVEENRQLREQLATREVRRATQRSESALDWLSQEVSTNIPRGTWDLIPAPVLSGPRWGARQTSWIGAGEKDGIETGMVALGPHSIVGVVVEVHSSTALVELVTDSRAIWGAEAEGRGELGLLKGTGDPRFVQFEFSQTVANTEVNDTIVSSGMAGSAAPGGIPFGKVQKLEFNRKGEPVALIRLPEEPGKLRTLFILPEKRIPTSPQED